MGLRTLGGLILSGVLAAVAPLALAQTWTRVPGALADVAAGRDGSVYGLTRGTPTAAGLPIVRWNASTQTWTPVPGLATRLAVANNGELWAVNGQGQIFRSANAGANWTTVVLSASDVSARGMVWAVGTNNTPYRLNPATSRWDAAPGPAVRIAAGNETGLAYMLDSSGTVWRRNSTSNDLMSTPWQRMDGAVLSDFTVDAYGVLWGVTRTAEPTAPGNFRLVSLNTAGQWETRVGAAAKISASQTDVWAVTAAGEVFRAPALNPSGVISSPTITSTLPTTLTLSTPSTPSAPTTPSTPVIQVSGANPGVYFESEANNAMKGGEALCEGNACQDAEIKPYYVGPYRLDMNCGTAGTGYNNGNLNYSALWGGTCWKCPENDGKGNPWNWDVSKVNTADACWRVPFEAFGPATWVKSGFAHECDASKGEFYDIYKADGGLGQSCWKCADAAKPRRSQFLVAGPMACATPVREAQEASLWKYNGCPTPVASSMNLPGKMQPGRPFLNVARGWSEGVLSGGCYACPATDSQGNMVATGDYDCSLDFKWKPNPFPAPGLAGLDFLVPALSNGAITNLLLERRLLTDHTAISALLLADAYAQGMNDAAASAYVRTEWPKLAAAPYQHKVIRSAVFMMLLSIAQKPASSRTSVETAAYQALVKYMTLRRQWLANQALNMYDSWFKSANERYARNPMSKTNPFHYGIVPINFTNTFAATMAPTAAAAGVIGAVAAGQAFSSVAQSLVTTATQATNAARTAMQAAQFSAEAMQAFSSARAAQEAASRAASLYGIASGNLSSVSSVASVVSGATVITVVASILGSIAIDQFVAIVTARPNLLNAVSQAANPVDVAALAATPLGRDQLQLAWGSAMDRTETEIPGVVTQMRTLQSAAAAANYAVK